jgi:hypothetical protein
MTQWLFFGGDGVVKESTRDFARLVPGGLVPDSAEERHHS